MSHAHAAHMVCHFGTSYPHDHVRAEPVQSLATREVYVFLLLTHTNQLLLVPLCDTNAGIRSIFRKHEWRKMVDRGDGLTDKCES